MLKVDFEMLCFFLAIGFFLIAWFVGVIMLIYSKMVYRQLIKVEPEFFTERSLMYYLTLNRNSQFVFYIVFNKHKKIKNEMIRGKCKFLKKITNFFLVSFFLCFIIFYVGVISKENLLFGIKAFEVFQKLG